MAKRKIQVFIAGLLLLTVIFSGCSGQTDQTNGQADKYETDQQTETPENTPDSETAALRIGGLKGPTSMGLVYMMEEAGENYTFTMAATADELLPQMINEELDIALLPANVAAILYQKTEGGVTVLDINTLGVLYMVSGNQEIREISDLKGQTVYLTGKGTTPDFVLQYLLAENGLTLEDVQLEYKSEATEVAALLAENPQAIGLLPQPFVTVACAQNDALFIVLDLTEAWDNVQGEEGSRLVTGVTVVRNTVLQENPQRIADFLAAHQASTEAINENPEEGAALVVSAGIIEKQAVAQQAIPFCNITCITGQEMQAALAGYLQVLYDQDSSSVGGALPEMDFYYIPEGQ
jgi:NitT/TauT family transport system substrate-binding protein